MPMPSIGASLRANSASESSSRPPLTKIVTSASPPWSRISRTRLRQRDEIAAVEANGADRYALRLEPRRQRHDLSRRGLGVVGVEQQHEIVRPRPGKGLERRRLVVERLDERVRHRAVERNAELLAGQHRRGPGEAGEIARARRHQTGFGAVRAAQAEIDQHLVGRGQHAPRRFGRNKRLKMQNVDQARFDELRLRHWRGDAQDRFVGKEHRALGHGVHVACRSGMRAR